MQGLPIVILISAQMQPKCKIYPLWFYLILAQIQPKCKTYPLGFINFS